MQKNQLPRAFDGEPGKLLIHVPAGNATDFSGSVTLVADLYCRKMLASRPIRFMVNSTWIVLEKEGRGTKPDSAVVGSVCITKSFPNAACGMNEKTANELLYLLEWIIVVSLFHNLTSF